MSNLLHLLDYFIHPDEYTVTLVAVIIYLAAPIVGLVWIGLDIAQA